MSDYQLTATDASVIRNLDGACIPSVVGNRDYDEYLKWLESGGVPDPYVPPEPVPPTPSAEHQILFDHENRILVMEGYEPLTVEEFLDKLG